MNVERVEAGLADVYKPEGQGAAPAKERQSKS